MKLGYGKVRKAAELGAVESDEAPTREIRLPLPRGKAMGRDVLAAADQAAAIVARAEEQARKLISAAEAQAAELRLRAEAEGRADAAATLAARALALSAREAASTERELDRLVEVARILAERLLGEALTLAPERIVALARQALAEARGARRVTIVAHPEDAARLERSLVELGLPPDLTRVVSDPRRPLHNLRLETDIGTLDAELAPQLERLALKLRETLGHG
ncbi:MAG TPA: FliH/SctL family protein [Polyangiaceae bacterium]|nr:FliH/SctL family protein [Polyangiaceae bacterium]